MLRKKWPCVPLSEVQERVHRSSHEFSREYQLPYNTERAMINRNRLVVISLLYFLEYPSLVGNNWCINCSRKRIYAPFTSVRRE